MASAPDGEARWSACDKETGLIYRAGNLPLADYRAEIKDARKAPMRAVMTRADPPSPVNVATPLGRNRESAIASSAGSP